MKINFDINKSKALILENDEGRFSLSPRGCFASALVDTKIVDENVAELSETNDFDGAFRVLVSRFEKYGLIDNGEGNKRDSNHNPSKLFKKTVRGFYPNATKDQVNAAFDLFVILMTEHGNTDKK